jgi:TolB protein
MISSVDRQEKRLQALLWKKFIALLVLTAIGVLILRQNASPPTPPSRFYESAFAVSHKGDQIVFTGRGQGGSDLYLLNLRARQVRRIAATPEEEGDPEFSRDDKSVVYVARDPSKKGFHVYISAQVYVHSIEAGQARQITQAGYNDHDPTFSPDGKKILFVRDQEYAWGGLRQEGWHKSALFQANADGTGLELEFTR